MKRTRSKWLVLVILLLAYLPVSGRAQEEVSLSSLEVALWPEYDRPEMLVVYKFLLGPGVSLPAEVAIRIPTRAGEPNAVAEKQVNGALFNAPYERDVQGEWAVIRYTATMPEGQLEYYDPGLQKDGAGRHFEYLWPGDYAVQQLSLEVQQPADAREMQIMPALGSGVQANDGLTYYTGELGSLENGETFQATVDYQKTSNALTVEFLQVQPSEPITAATPGRVTIQAALPWVLGLLGVLLIGTGVWWYLQLGREKSTPRRQPRRRKVAAQVASEEQTETNGIYCHQCGKRAGPGDRFCRACGTRLRVD